MKPVLCVVGTRPNFIKMAPLLRAMQAHSPAVPAVLVHTGQHYDLAMSARLFAALQLPEPAVNLEVGSGSHAWQTAEIMRRFEPLLDSLQPSAVLVVGDVNSTLACALVARQRAVPVLHVESGLRSHDRSMPEELNRVLTDQIADRLYTTERSAERNLLQEGIAAERVCFAGNVMIDSLQHGLPSARNAHDTLRQHGANAALLDQPQGYGVVTLPCAAAGPGPGILPGDPASQHWPAWAVALALVGLAALPHGLLGLLNAGAGHPAEREQALAAAPALQLGPRWPALPLAAPQLQPAYHQPSLQLQGRYGVAGRTVDLYVALYRGQERGHTLVASGNALLASDDPHWVLAGQKRQTLRVGPRALGLRSSELRTLDLKSALRQDGLLVWQLYWVQGRLTSSDFWARAYSAYHRLCGQSDDAAVLLAYAPLGVDGEGAAALADFWRDNLEALEAWLQQAALGQSANTVAPGGGLSTARSRPRATSADRR